MEYCFTQINRIKSTDYPERLIIRYTDFKPERLIIRYTDYQPVRSDNPLYGF